MTIKQKSLNIKSISIFMPKKAFFREAKKSEIKAKTLVEIANLAEILNLSTGEYAIIESPMPEAWQDPRKFLKHGSEVRLKRTHTIEQAIRESRTPVQLREEKFNNIRNYLYCAYSFIPVGTGIDQRRRKVSLASCLEGARIFAYSHQLNVPIKIREYADARRVSLEGAEVVFEVPSRTEKKDRHQFKMMSVPIIDSPEKYKIALNISSDHSCPEKRFKIRYRSYSDKEGSQVFNFCSHEIAGYLELIQLELEKNKNLVPLQMCQFAIPSQAIVDYYLKLNNNVLVKDESLACKDKLRLPNRADEEIALWFMVRNFGHDPTFYSDKSRDGNVRNYNWR